MPEAYLLRLTIDPPHQWRGGLAGLLKPLTDGVIAALHTHNGPTDAVAERAAAVDPQLSAAEVARLLTEHRDVPLGAVRLVVPWGNSVQWHPADDQIVGLDARIVRTGESPRRVGRLDLVRRWSHDTSVPALPTGAA